MEHVLEIEVDENGTLTLPAEILRGARPHDRFVVESHDEQRLLLSRSVAAEAPSPDRASTLTEAARLWRQKQDSLAKEIAAVWPENVSAVDVVSEMRR